MDFTQVLDANSDADSVIVTTIEVVAEKNKKEVVAKKPERFPGESRFDKRQLNMLPVEPDRRGKGRKAPWEKIKELPKRNTPSRVFKVVASAIEEIRLDDLLTLIALTGIMQDAIVVGSVRKHTIEEAGGREFSLVSKVFQVSQICPQAAGDNDIQAFLASIARLQSYQCTYYQEDGSEMIAKYLYKYAYDAGSNEISLLLDATAIQYYASCGWIIGIKDIRKLKMSPSRALVLYLSQQTGSLFLIDLLADKIGLNYTRNKEIRRNLRQVLDELKDHGYISGYDMDSTYVRIFRDKLVIQSDAGTDIDTVAE